MEKDILTDQVQNEATLYFDDDSSLVQINDFANTGNISNRRSTSLISNFDYTYWSSPVDGQSLYNLSSDCLSDKLGDERLSVGN